MTENPNQPVEQGGPIDPTVVSVVTYMANNGKSAQEIAVALHDMPTFLAALNDMRAQGQREP